MHQVLLDAVRGFCVLSSHANQLHGDQQNAGFQKKFAGESFEEQGQEKQSEAQHNNKGGARIRGLEGFHVQFQGISFRKPLTIGRWRGLLTISSAWKESELVET
jgi:hypothetical protein